MAWFDSYGQAPAIVKDGYKETESYTQFIIAPGAVLTARFTRLATVETTEYPGLTLAAAQAGAEALQDKDVQVNYRQENPAAAYTLQKTTVTKTEWVQDT